MRDEILRTSSGVANLQALMDVIDKPAIGVNRSADVLLVNAPAEALFRNGDLVALRRRLGGGRTEETAALRSLVASAAMGRAAGGGGKLVVSRPGAAMFVLLFAPLAGARYKRQNQPAIMLVNDPNRLPAQRIDFDLLRAQFHLTRAEAEVVEGLQNGLPLKAASPTGASFATARTHLARVFQKTGAHSQAELVNLLRKAGYDG